MNEDVSQVKPDRTVQKNGASSLSRVWRIAGKELTEVLRDRRTIITLVLMPLLVYPLLGMVVQKFTLQSLGESTETVYRLVFEDSVSAEEFMRLLNEGDRLLDSLVVQTPSRESQSVSSAIGDPPPATSEAVTGNAIADALDRQKIAFKYFTTDGEPVDAMVADASMDVGIIQVQDPQSGLRRFQLLYDARSEFGRNALQYIGRRLRLLNDSYLEAEIRARDIAIAPPARYLEQPVTYAAVGQPVLLTFVPLMLVLMTITGAVYPAIDLTAGERERGTMEILVAAPISRLVLLFGKFVAVVAVAMLTASANLVAMVITIYSIGLDSAIFGQSSFSIWTLLSIILLLFVLAAFFSATLLGLTSFARSFKEAQAYLIPLMLIAFAPGLLSLNPALKTNSLLAIVPLLNVVMAGRDLLAGNANMMYVFLAILSTCFYGLFALAWAARIFGADSILTGGFEPWSQMFSGTSPSRPCPTVSTALLFLAVLFPLFVVAAGLVSNLATRAEATVEQRLWLNALVTILVFAGLPLAFVFLFRLSPGSTFQLQAPTLVGIAAAVMLGLSVWVIAYESEVISLSSKRLKEMMDWFASLKLGLNQVPLWVKLVCLALVPAVCEEFTFRGFLLTAFRRRTTAANAVFITALLFGLFHVFVRDLLFLERMIPSTLMGLLLGFVCIRTGSIWPGMLLHAIHNGLLITLAHYEDWLVQFGFAASEQSHLPWLWILIAMVPASIGMAILLFNQRRTPIPDRSTVVGSFD